MRMQCYGFTAVKHSRFTAPLRHNSGFLAQRHTSALSMLSGGRLLTLAWMAASMSASAPYLQPSSEIQVRDLRQKTGSCIFLQSLQGSKAGTCVARHGSTRTKCQQASLLPRVMAHHCCTLQCSCKLSASLLPYVHGTSLLRTIMLLHMSGSLHPSQGALDKIGSWWKFEHWPGVHTTVCEKY